MALFLTWGPAFPSWEITRFSMHSVRLNPHHVFNIARTWQKPAEGPRPSQHQVSLGGVSRRARKPLGSASSLLKFFDLLLRAGASAAGASSTHWNPTLWARRSFVACPKASLKFCCGDPKIVQGSTAYRKPDAVLVCEDSEQLKNSESADLPNGPELTFYWDELYCCVEFKGTPLHVLQENESSDPRSLSVPHASRGSKSRSPPAGSTSSAPPLANISFFAKTSSASFMPINPHLLHNFVVGVGHDTAEVQERRLTPFPEGVHFTYPPTALFWAAVPETI